MKRFSIHFALFVCFACISFPLAAASYYTEGHADMGLGDDDELELHLHCHGGSGGSVVDGALLSAGVEFEPSAAIVVVPQSTYYYINSQGGATGEAVSQLGLNEGDPYWFIPEHEETLNGGGASQLFSPHLGIGAEDVEYSVFDNESITLKLISLSGPSGGAFAMSQLGNWLMSSVLYGIGNEDIYADFPVGGHEHAQWYFTKPGVYKIEFESSAAINGEPVADTNTFTFIVGGTVWKGTNSSNWNDSGNWLSGMPTAGSTLIFTSTAVVNQPLTQNIATTLDLHGIIFTANAAAYQLGGQTVRLSVDSPEITSESANNQIIGNPLELAADTTAAVNGSGSVTLSGTIGGAGSLTKTGTGTLILANQANYSGETVIEDGALALTADGQLPNSAVRNNACFQIISGEHTISSIDGNGATEVLAGILHAGSIRQNTLAISSGATVAIIPITGQPLCDSGITPVPEPGTFGLLITCLTAIFTFRFRGRIRFNYRNQPLFKYNSPRPL